jgi:hypothetical protein
LTPSLCAWLAAVMSPIVLLTRAGEDFIHGPAGLTPTLWLEHSVILGALLLKIYIDNGLMHKNGAIKARCRNSLYYDEN